MATVTQAIKMKPVKDFLDSNFPKPKIDLPELSNDDMEYYTPRTYAGVEGTMVDLFIKLNTLPIDGITDKMMKNPDKLPLGATEILEQVLTGINGLTNMGWGSDNAAITDWNKNGGGLVLTAWSDLTNDKKISELNLGDYFAFAEMVSVFRGGPFVFTTVSPQEMSMRIDAAMAICAAAERDNKRFTREDLDKIDKDNTNFRDLYATLFDAQIVFDKVREQLKKIDKNRVINGGTIEETSKTIDKGDWDMVYDKSLLDVKNTKNYKFTLDQWRQLITYYLLSNSNYDIHKVGIWFTRFGVIYEIDLDNYFKENGITEEKLNKLHDDFLKV